MTKRNRVPKPTDFHSVLSEIECEVRARSASGEVGKQLLTLGTERPIVCEMQLRGLWG